MIPNPHLERLRLLYPVRWRLAAGLFFMALTVVVQLAFPKAIAHFIDNIGKLKDAGLPAHLGLLMLGIIVAESIASALQHYLFDSSGHLIVTRIRRKLFEVVINQPVGFHDRHHVGELTSRLTADVQSLHETLTRAPSNALRSVCVFAGGLVMLLHISPSLSMALAFFVPASLYLGKLSGAQYRVRARQAQSSLADSGKVAHEHLANVRLVHAFNQQDGALSKYVKATGHLLAVSLASSRLMAGFQGILSMLGLLALLVTLWFGAHLIGQGQLSVGDLTAFVIYSAMVTASSSSVSEFWTGWMRSIGATDRIFEILRSHRPPKTQAGQAALKGAIAFRGAVFSYPERAGSIALKGIDFSIAAGEKVALVGASGAGKTTIASIILGHYRLDEGSVLFDQIDATSLAVAGIRSHMAVVEQEPALFSGSIAENIAFAVPEREVSQEEVICAAQRANAHEFICGFPDGYDTVVGERGLQLSGGQKQRIAIARAMLRDPKILILDEATSALDAASELLVQRALGRLMAGRTTIIIAHRFSTIMKADRILVMQDGRIAQQGSHAELFAHQDGLYHELMGNQLLQYSELSAATEQMA